MEAQSSDVDIDLASVRHAEDSFMVLGDYMDETGPLNDSVSALEDSQSQSSESLPNIDLSDDIEKEVIDTTESIDLNEQQANQEMEEVSIWLCRS